ncbi:hypothetical protein N656DRAFT_783244 [Canariomyces notabilis]|uniref:Uncharacterized protein n=1 Tax=Canariomyces notabilis TaxID=2074819 RepID=A0AAN6QFJ7_9PEZI|nr:hypothetical protein N656DRAFT_783244 [Canariomyces arenarius]
MAKLSVPTAAPSAGDSVSASTPASMSATMTLPRHRPWTPTPRPSHCPKERPDPLSLNPEVQYGVLHAVILLAYLAHGALRP